MLFAIVVSLMLRVFAIGARFLFLMDNYLSVRIFVVAMITISKTFRPVLYPGLMALNASVF
jgi:hypothetical protein